MKGGYLMMKLPYINIATCVFIRDDYINNTDSKIKKAMYGKIYKIASFWAKRILTKAKKHTNIIVKNDLYAFSNFILSLPEKYNRRIVVKETSGEYKISIYRKRYVVEISTNTTDDSYYIRYVDEARDERIQTTSLSTSTTLYGRLIHDSIINRIMEIL